MTTQQKLIEKYDWYGPHMAHLGLSVDYSPRCANLYGADLRRVNLYGADLSGADLCGADLCGAKWNTLEIKDIAQVSARSHGEYGRQLLGILLSDGTIQTQCGCWSGTDGELEDWIENGREDLAESRLRALRCLRIMLGKEQ